MGAPLSLQKVTIYLYYVTLRLNNGKPLLWFSLFRYAKFTFSGALNDWEFRSLRRATRATRPRLRRLLKKADENFFARVSENFKHTYKLKFISLRTCSFT